MAKYIYKIYKDNKIASLKVIESLYPFVGNISEKLKDFDVYYIRVSTHNKDFGYSIANAAGKRLYKEYVDNFGYIPGDITLDCINIGDIL